MDGFLGNDMKCSLFPIVNWHTSKTFAHGLSAITTAVRLNLWWIRNNGSPNFCDVYSNGMWKILGLALFRFVCSSRFQMYLINLHTQHSNKVDAFDDTEPLSPATYGPLRFTKTIREYWWHQFDELAPVWMLAVVHRCVDLMDDDEQRRREVTFFRLKRPSIRTSTCSSRDSMHCMILDIP